jgi:hypothetical protein
LRRASTSDTPLLATGTPEVSRPPAVVSYPIELPLHCVYDAVTGELVVETPVVHAGADANAVLLRLQFSGDATRIFVAALRALEDADVAITGIEGGFRVQ